MQASFHSSEKIDKKAMQACIQKQDAPAILRFIVLYGLFIAAFVSVILCWNYSLLYVIMSQVFFGLIFCSLFACEHETVHNTAFKTLWLNKAAAFMAGLGSLYASTMFRELHFMHHRHTHVPGKDPEISIGNMPVPSVISNPPMYLSWLSGFPLLLFKIGMLINGAIGMPEFIRKNVYPYVDPKVRRKLMLESIIILAVHLLFLYIALYVNAAFWAIFIGQVSGHCCLAFYTAAEHNGLPHEGTIFEKTRSVRANKLVKFVMWNMPYHAEHHAYPAVPFHQLPQLHQLLDKEIVHSEDSHLVFHRKSIKKMFL